MAVITASDGTIWSPIRRRRNGAITAYIQVFRARGDRFVTVPGSSLWIDGADLDPAAARPIQ